MPNYVISIRKKDSHLTPDQWVAGTSVVQCSNCGEDVLVSPSSMAQIQQGALVRCAPCETEIGHTEDFDYEVAPGAMEEIEDQIPGFQEMMMAPMAENFSALKPGDTCTRMLAGLVPVKVQVEKIENGLIYMKGGWTFDAIVGIEEDEELGWGVKFNYTGSYLILDE